MELSEPRRGKVRMKHLLCFGMGFSARALCRRLINEGDWQITGTSRSEAGAASIAAAGMTGCVFDGARPSPGVAAALDTATHVLVSAGPDGEGDPVLNHHDDDVRNAPNVKWIGYLSTVGVYGDQEGRWVDEETPVSPLSERSRRRVAAENRWLKFAEETGKPVQIFRLSGIYGPGRSAIDQLIAGKARRINKPGQVFNRIHVDDIAKVVRAAMDGHGRHAIYNVTDNEPAPPQDVVAYAAELLGMAPPPEIPFEDADLSPMGRSFYSELKRVSNERAKADLGVTLDCPTYREGMAAILKAQAANS